MASDWANLPKHHLDSVVERLVSLSDYLRFSIVCASWHCIAKDSQNQRAKMTTPMLLVQSGKRGRWGLYDVMENKVLNLQLKVPNKRFCGSSKGWLIFVDKDYLVTLINPFFRVKGMRNKENSIICLPPLAPLVRRWEWVKKTNYFCFKAIISADPILNAKDYIVLAIYENRCQLAFIRPNKDITWTFVDERWHFMIRDGILVADKFYIVDTGRKLFSLDTATNSDCDLKFADTKRLANKKYLVDLHEKGILMVERYWDIRDNKRVTTEFRIFKLNLDKCEWIEISTLGEFAVFVGDNSSVCVVASNYSRCQPNCIYFNHDYVRADIDFKPWGPHDFGVYNIKNQSFSQPYHEDAMTMIKMTNRPPIWVEPAARL